MVLTSALGSTFMGRGLHPCLVTSYKVVWNALWPSGALSSIQLMFACLGGGIDDLK